VDEVITMRGMRNQRGKALSASPAAQASRASGDGTTSCVDAVQRAIAGDSRLLDRHTVEKMTSLDITTIYRRMAAGTFPQPVRVGRRRVAWRTNNIMQWQQALEVGTQTLRWKTRSPGNVRGKGRGRRGH
jgi:prophage regulatory protein